MIVNEHESKCKCKCAARVTPSKMQLVEGYEKTKIGGVGVC